MEICICEAIKTAWHQPFNRYRWIVEREINKGKMEYHSLYVVVLGQTLMATAMTSLSSHPLLAVSLMPKVISMSGWLIYLYSDKNLVVTSYTTLSTRVISKKHKLFKFKPDCEPPSVRKCKQKRAKKRQILEDGDGGSDEDFVAPTPARTRERKIPVYHPAKMSLVPKVISMTTIPFIRRLQLVPLLPASLIYRSASQPSKPTSPPPLVSSMRLGLSRPLRDKLAPGWRLSRRLKFGVERNAILKRRAMEEGLGRENPA